MHRAKSLGERAGAHRPPVPAHGCSSQSAQRRLRRPPRDRRHRRPTRWPLPSSPTHWRGGDDQMCAHRRPGRHVAASTPNRSRFPRVIMRLGVTKSRGRLAQSAASSHHRAGSSRVKSRSLSGSQVQDDVVVVGMESAILSLRPYCSDHNHGNAAMSLSWPQVVPLPPRPPRSAPTPAACSIPIPIPIPRSAATDSPLARTPPGRGRRRQEMSACLVADRSGLKGLVGW